MEENELILLQEIDGELGALAENPVALALQEALAAATSEDFRFPEEVRGKHLAVQVITINEMTPLELEE